MHEAGVGFNNSDDRQCWTVLVSAALFSRGRCRAVQSPRLAEGGRLLRVLGFASAFSHCPCGPGSSSAWQPDGIVDTRAAQGSHVTPRHADKGGRGSKRSVASLPAATGDVSGRARGGLKNTADAV